MNLVFFQIQIVLNFQIKFSLFLISPRFLGSSSRINIFLKRYQGVLKNSNSGSSHTNKVDAVKEELEDIELKVEQCKVCV